MGRILSTVSLWKGSLNPLPHRAGLVLSPSEIPDIIGDSKFIHLFSHFFCRHVLGGNYGQSIVLSLWITE